jgi:hypothetical protein
MLPARNSQPAGSVEVCLELGWWLTFVKGEGGADGGCNGAEGGHAFACLG